MSKIALATTILLIGAQRHMLYELTQQRALWWNLCGALAIISLLGLVVFRERGWKSIEGAALALACCWFLYEEVLVSVCSAWRIFDWWPVGRFDNQCIKQFGAKATSLGILLVGAAIAAVTVRADRGTSG